MSPVNDKYGKKGLAGAEHRVRMCQLAAETSPFIMVDSWEASQPSYQRTLTVLQRLESILNNPTPGPYPPASSSNPGSSTSAEGYAAPPPSATGQGAALTPSPSARDHSRHPSGGKAWDPSADPSLNPSSRSAAGDGVRVVLVCGGDVLRSFTEPGVWIPHQVEAILEQHGVVCVARHGADARDLIFSSDLLYSHRASILVADTHIRNNISSSKIRTLLSRGCSARYLLPDAVLHYAKDHGLYSQEPGHVQKS